MSIKFIPTVAALALFLTACGNDAPVPAMGDSVARATDEAQETTVDVGALCIGAGPQTPRDISSPAGSNTTSFALAPASTEMNLCNIHTHTNAEHKGPGFGIFVDNSDHGGYACNDTESLTEEELRDPSGGNGAFEGVKPGDTIEVHWAHSSCDVAPGETLGACISEACTDPIFRVEAQAFLVVNDPDALDFNDFDYSGSAIAGLHQAKSLPQGTGEPVIFRGSTTGPSYTQSNCSSVPVTWSVRPNCSRVDISSLHAWAAKGNAFNETKSHGVRQLVTAKELLAPIE